MSDPTQRRWEAHVAIEDVGRVVLRPIRPEDERLYETFLPHITPDDLRLRLFAPTKALSHKFLARMTQIDYAREMAFVAIAGDSGEMLGVSRFSADPDYENAEYGVLVRSDLKGKGLGWNLMNHLVDFARASGIAQLYGSVLAENATMLRMCRELGFSVRCSSPTIRLSGTSPFASGNESAIPTPDT